MCGIGGLVNFSPKPIAAKHLQQMADIIIHRGPDDEGYFYSGQISLDGFSALTNAHESLVTDASYSLGLCHRRLAILDLSTLGRQPMSSPDGKLWLTYNGEIYNYLELRQELAQDYNFKSHTDSEVVLAAYQKWGEDCLHKFNGMFSFIIYDQQKHQLFGARDRYGIKPFYYRHNKEGFSFASEIKQLLLNDQPAKFNEHNLQQFVIYGDVNCFDSTCFAGVQELLAGQKIKVNLQSGQLKTSDYYWNQLQLEPATKNNFAEWQEEFETLFTDSVKLRMRSDVDVGACLSGGLDSSSIVCLASQLSDKPMQTFTSCFADKRFDEWEFAEQVVKSAKASPHKAMPNLTDLVKDMDNLMWHQEEPFRTSSIYAQYSVMKLAHENNIKVLLDGQGADEALSGYHWYIPIYLANRLSSGHPRQFLGDFLKMRSSGVVSATEPMWRVLAKSFYYLQNFSSRHQRAKSKFFAKNLSYHRDIDFFTDFHENQMQDIRSNLDSLLRHEDRNSMAFSIESRTPFLDYRLVEFLLTVPLNYRFHGGWTKSLLRHTMKNKLPNSVNWRVDKKGFVTPEHEFLNQLYEMKFSEVFQHSQLETWFDFDELKSGFKNKSLPQEVFWRAHCVDSWLRRFEL